MLVELQHRLRSTAFPGDPIIEQEYQKTIPNHGIAIRPDLIIHILFERGDTKRREEGNFVAIELKLAATAAEADEDFESLTLMKEKLGYPLTIFLNLDAAETYVERCSHKIASQTVCFAVQLKDRVPNVVVKRR